MRKALANPTKLANQFVASIYYINKHHDLQTLSATDTIRNDKKENDSAPVPQDGTDTFMPGYIAELI
jgi:mediator of RNA polymerase II transcription subunit 21